MKKTLKTVLLLLFIVLFTSCSSIEVVTLVDGTIYTNFDARVAYDVYNELYNNGVYEYKPILIAKEQP